MHVDVRVHGSATTKHMIFLLPILIFSQWSGWLGVRIG